MQMRIALMAFAVTLFLGRPAVAGTSFFYDDFEDSDAHDESPVAWNETYPAGLRMHT